MKKNNSEAIDTLMKAITEISSVKECKAFFEDLCTIKELQDMAQRLETAILLNEGHSYQKISETVGISTTTISRVNRCLVYGNDGYKTAIEKLTKGNTND